MNLTINNILWAAGLILSAVFISACDNSDDEKAAPNLSTPYEAFASKAKFVTLNAHFTEAKLKFESSSNPTGIFVSEDTDNSNASDAAARQELIRLAANGTDIRAAYWEYGNPNGTPVVFIHGLPTWSYSWRNILPSVNSQYRIIAVDLLGQGLSSAPNLTYTAKQHLAFLEAFLDELGIKNRQSVIVSYDVGAIVGLAYASRFPNQIKGLAFYETLFGPVPEVAAFRGLPAFGRSTEGQSAIINDNYFIEGIMANLNEISAPNDAPMALNPLSEADLEAYRIPYPSINVRKQAARWFLEFPVLDASGPGDANIQMAGGYAQYLMTSSVPKLHFYTTPGFGTPQPVVDFIAGSFNTGGSLTQVNLGDGYHYHEEDYPEKMTEEINKWLSSLP